MSYIVVVKELSYGSVQFINRNEKVKNSLELNCFMETWNEANEIVFKVKRIYEGTRSKRLDYRVMIIPASSIITKLKEKQLKHLVFSIDKSDLL